jgi:hypothetical protein
MKYKTGNPKIRNIKPEIYNLKGTFQKYKTGNQKHEVRNLIIVIQKLKHQI